jgi:hypothetical protein
MSQRPGHVDVVTEVGYCNFCNRTRNLRREEHHLGGLMRTIVSCETCHRTLSNTMGVAAEPEPAKAEPEAVEAQPAEEKPKLRRAAAKSASPRRTTPRASTEPAAKPRSKTPPKPRSTAKTKKTTTRKK